MPRRVAFAGTPVFAQVALKALVEAGHEVIWVLSQPDRPSGRGMKLKPSAVREYAIEQNIACYTPTRLRGPQAGEIEDTLKNQPAQDLHKTSPARRAGADSMQLVRQAGTTPLAEFCVSPAPDVLVVAAYGLILPRWLLELPRLGCLNIHASLLPRWRGAAPIMRSIEAGDSHTGITLMHMDEGLDTGDILAMQSIPIEANDTAQSVHDKLSALGAQMLLQALTQDPQTWPRVPQPQEGVTYAEKIQKSEGELNPIESDAVTLERKVRAFNPFPGARLIWGGESLKVLRAHVHEASLSNQVAGTISVNAERTALLVQCQSSVLAIDEVQRAGARAMSMADYLRGHAE